MVKKKSKNHLWKRLHFKYRLSATNENTLEEIWKIKVSMFWGGVLLLLFALTVVFVTSLIIITTPIRYYLPGYLDSEVREQAIRTAIKADSIEQQLAFQNAYLENLKEVFRGTVQVDSVKNLDTISVKEDDPLLMKSKSEVAFVQHYSDEEKYNLSILPSNSSNVMDGVIFFKPVKGYVVTKFDPAHGSYGIKIKVSSREPVSAVMEGTVIASGLDARMGNIIQIQHKNGFMSIYKHCDILLKKAGEKVRTGEGIAIVGNEKESTDTNSVLGFELWYKGAPENPENYISF